MRRADPVTALTRNPTHATVPEFRHSSFFILHSSLKIPLLGILAAFAVQAQAIEFIATNTYVVGAGTVVADEQWVVTGIAETEGTFKNDLFIASGNPLHLNGTFEGNIWGAASMEANLAGECLRNVRLMGKTVKVDGRIGGNLMAMAETIIIGTNATIGGSVRLIGTSVIQEGSIEGNLDISAVRIATLGGTIKGNAKVFTQDILLPRDRKIGGNLSYTANKELVPAEGVVGGKLERAAPQSPPPFSTAKVASHAMWFFAALLAGIPFITLFPMTTAMSAQLIKKSPWKCMLAGFIAFWALLFVGLTCISSLIGLPLGLLILASWGILAYLSHILVGLVFGTMILRSVGNSIGKVVLSMAIGLAVIYLAALIPSPYYLFQQVVAWFGMGSIILALFEKRRLIIQVPQHLKQAEALKNEHNNPTEDSQ
jgi:cytoskeletal protein CcmA (bactofilin family)